MREFQREGLEYNTTGVKQNNNIETQKLSDKSRAQSGSINILRFMNTRLLLLALLVIFTQQTAWDNWNTYAAANYATVHAYSQPTIPASFSRYTDTSNSQSSYGARVNQYKYLGTPQSAPGTCSLYCGPRSFLTTDGSGNLVCKRDQNSNFWGGQSGYTQFCIPDVDTSDACNEVANYLNAYGACNMFFYGENPTYENLQCCYDGSNSVGAMNSDLTNKDVGTAYYNLRNAE